MVEARFWSRCPYAMEICATHPPDFVVTPGHAARCWVYDPAVQSAAAAGTTGS
jgi:ABC-type dipeptide/oligopeptide/nickel transport system ATPase component